MSWTTPASAQPPAAAFMPLAHTAWTVRDGAPAAVRGLAQSADGVLWIASERGLYHFDGVRFNRFEPPPGQTLSPNGAHVLLALPDTSLWVGHFTGGVTVLRRGRVVSYDTTDGLPGGTVTAIARDSTGTMWASTTRGLARLVGERWDVIGGDDDYPGGFTEPVLVDARGSVWVAREGQVYVLPRGGASFGKRDIVLPRGLASNVHWLASAPDGSIWAVQRPLGMFQVADARGDSPREFTRAYADTLPFAVTFAGGPAVVVSMSGRLVRLPPEAVATASGRAAIPASEVPFSRAAGMSGDRVMTALYDREGTLWVGTPTGIDRFRETKLTPVEWPGAVSWPAVAADTNGAVWVAARNGSPATLFSVDAHAVPERGAPATLTCIYRDLAGGIWIGGEHRLWERRRGVLLPVPLPPRPVGATSAALPVHAIARDLAGRLWVSIATDGVYRRSLEGQWQRFGVTHGLGRTAATAITTDSSGRTWLGYSNGQIALAVGDSVRILTAADGLDVGSVLAIAVHGDRVWVGGQVGVAVLPPPETGRSHSSFVKLATAGEPLRGVSGVVQTANGELWLNGADGVTRIAAAEAQRAISEPGYRARNERLDHRDGIEPPAPQIRPLPSAVAGSDGRLWFTSAGGVSWVDPARVRRNVVPPPVRLLSLTADGRRYESDATATDALRLPQRTTALSVAYTAYSLAVPERVQFRYRLDGLDTAWQDAGSRREAFYTNLRPGSYAFRVIASNDDGVWNDAGAALSFEVPPAWYQTAWFRALVVLLIGAFGAATAALVQRSAHVRSRAALEARFEATLAERSRIAQDLHDTLLQGFAGVTLQLKTAELALPEQPDVAAETLLRVQRLARESLREARERVWDMRESEQRGEDLPDAIEAMARERTPGGETDVVVTTSGERRRLTRPVEDAALRVCREAVTNALRHAGARRIEILVAFGTTELRVEVRDDGRGFTRAEADGAARRGHFGVSGMKERAARMGGRCDIRARPEGGTAVVLELPLDVGGAPSA